MKLDRKINPLPIIAGVVVSSFLIGSVGNLLKSRYQEKIENDKPQISLMESTYNEFSNTDIEFDRQLIEAQAFNFLQSANQTSAPLVWIRTKFNNTLYDLTQMKNSRLLYSSDEIAKIQKLRTELSALAMLSQAIEKGTQSTVENAVNISDFSGSVEAVRSVFDSQVIEKAYPLSK